MNARRECEFYLLQYVPDPVRNEFVHVGVILWESTSGEVAAAGGVGESETGAKKVAVKFTSDWRRVRCFHPEADIGMLEGLEGDLRRRFAQEPAGNLMRLLQDSFSNSVQITESKAYLAESVEAGLEELMRLYVDPLKREKESRLAGRAAIQQRMRSEFERAGVWDLLRKRIEAAQYTRVGDPLRIDAGYRPNGVIRMFQAVSLDAGAEMAKVLAFSEAGLRAGVQRVEKADLELTAIVEPVRGREQGTGIREQGSGNREQGRKGKGSGAGGLGTQMDGGGFDEERLAAYRFAVETMEEHRIRVLTTADLSRVAETARRELRV